MIAVLLCLVTNPADAINEDNVLVLYNIDSPDGVEIANYYAQAHPGVQTLGLTGISAVDEEISGADYLNVLRPQVLGALNDSIDVIVTTKGLPLHVDVDMANPLTYPGWRGATIGLPSMGDGDWFEYSSLESELMRIDTIDSLEEMGDQVYLLSDSVLGPFWGSDHQANNPYYLSTTPFTHNDPSKVPDDRIRLSTRLDAFTVDDVKAMIDRSYLAVIDPPDRDFILDNDPNPGVVGGSVSSRIDQLSAALAVRGVAHQYDDTNNAITQSSGRVLGYVSLGTNDSGTLQSDYIHNQLGFDIANGAVFHSYESWNARSFDPNWTQGQALIAQWIEAGGTAALGQVWEGGDGPINVTNEDLFFQYMLDGYTFAEAFAYSTHMLSYVNTAIGDPLMRWIPRFAGDINLDQQVNSTDLTIFKVNYLQSGGWMQGDLNGDGMVTPGDLTILKLSFGQTNPFVNGGGGSGVTSIPEPVMGFWMLVIGLVVMARRGGASMRTREG